MAKHPNVSVAKSTKDFAVKNAELLKQGYVPMTKPGKYVHNNGGGYTQSWGDMVNAKLAGGAEDGKKHRKGLPTLFASSGNENMTGATEIGSKGLGWIEWGNGNEWPNVCSLMTDMLPYTAASWKFNTDLLEGMGPQPMYRYTQYVGGNITQKEIPFMDAGTLIKGWIMDLQRTIKSETSPTPQPLPQEGSDVGTESSQSSSQTSSLPREGQEGGAYLQSLKDQLSHLKQDYMAWEHTKAELQTFLDNNSLHEIFLPLAGDQQMMGICFPEILLNQQALDDNKQPVATKDWRPKVTGIRYRRAHVCRLERMDDNDRINYVYISNKWLDKPYVETNSTAAQKVAALPALSVQTPLQDLQEAVRKARSRNGSISSRPTRFIMPTYYPTPGRPYYPVPVWHSIFGGSIYEYAATIIDDRLKRKQHSNVIGRVIYLHNDYLQSLWSQQSADNKQSIEEIRDELYDEINTWLGNPDNAGQSLIGFNFMGPDGKEHKSFEIVEIESNDKDTAEANQKELQEISSIIFFSMGVDAKLIGNTPGDTTSSGGTDLRERYLLKQIQMSATQQLLLKPLEVATRFNEWDEHLVWRIAREVLTTLDNSKTGVTQAENSNA